MKINSAALAKGPNVSPHQPRFNLGILFVHFFTRPRPLFLFFILFCFAVSPRQDGVDCDRMAGLRSDFNQ